MSKTKRYEGKVIIQLRDFGTIESDSFKKEIHFELRNLERSEQLEVSDIVSFSLNDNKNKLEALEIKLVKLQKEKQENKKRKKISPYALKDKNELKIAFLYLKEKLEYLVKKKKQFDDEKLIEDQAQKYLDIIVDLISGPSPNIGDVDIQDINNLKGGKKNRAHEEYWLYAFDIDKFAEEVIELTDTQVDKGVSQDFSIVWGEWRSQEKQIFNAGYTKGHFNYSYVDKGEIEQTHVYETPPPLAKWPLKKVRQKGNVFYISAAPVNQIAQSTYVPSLPPNIDVEETANRVLDQNLKENEWQREIDQKRIIKIEQFIGESDNIIANTPMLFIKNPEHAIIKENNNLFIDFDKFLQIQKSGEHNGKYIDRKKRKNLDDFGNTVYDDYRPLWLIDGQHRVKGIHRNEKEQGLTIPIIIFPHDFGMKATAKVFAEINTLQKKLNPLHELFMQHRFSIDHTKTKRKFRDYTKTNFENAENQGWSNDWIHSRANHLSYEILAMLAKKGPLKNKVRFLPQNENNKSIMVSADQWVNYARDWFYAGAYKYKGEDNENYILNPSAGENKMILRDVFFKEVLNYFEAWVENCNHKDWEDGRPRWTENSRNKGLIQKKTFFIILLELYNLTYLKTKNNKRMHGESGILTKADFLETLKPFKWVDWTDRELQGTYPASGEKGRRSLEAWMSDAIINAKSYGLDGVHNPKIKSQPGKGITSYLSKPSLEITSTNSWPTKNKNVELTSKRPFNSRYESKWFVSDKSQNIIQEGSVSVLRHMPPSDAKFIVKYHKSMAWRPEITVKVEWQNAHTRRGFEEIVLKKPIDDE